MIFRRVAFYVSLLLASSLLVSEAQRCKISCEDLNDLQDKVNKMYDHMFGENDDQVEDGPDDVHDPEDHDDQNDNDAGPPCDEYHFTLTSQPGTWYQARGMCRRMGGDLMHKNLGPEGAKYHDELRELIRTSSSAWLGLTDRKKEGVWRRLDGRVYDGSDQDGLVSWQHPNPDNWGPVGEDCAEIRHYEGDLNDLPCVGYRRHGLCEIRNEECSEDLPVHNLNYPPGYNHYGTYSGDEKK